MKPQHTALLTAFLYFSFFLHAQTKIIDSALNKSKTNAELSLVNKTSDKVNEGLNKVFSGEIFKKKTKIKEKTTPESETASFQVGSGKTLITITNTDYTLLSSFLEALRTNTQVTGVEKEFANNIGTLKVSHNGLSDAVLDDLLKKTGSKLEVVDISGGKINLKVK